MACKAEKTENMKKRTFYTEMAYIVGLVMLAVCTALMAHGGLRHFKDRFNFKIFKESEGK